MKKAFLLVVALISLSVAAHAQYEEPTRTVAISVGPEIDFPSRTVFTLGYGGSARVEVPVANQFGVSASGGYTNLVYKSSIFGGSSNKPSPAGFVPLKLGVIYYAGGASLEGELGTVLSQKDDVNGNKPSLFAFSLGPSFLLPLGDSKTQHIQVGVRYESWSQNTLREVALRVAYHFGL